MQKNMISKINNQFNLEGKYFFTLAKIKTAGQRRLNDKIEEWRRAGIDIMPLVRELNRRCRVEKVAVQNLLPTVGRTMIANNIFAASGTPDNTPLVSHIALGTDATAPANGDTTLGTEVYRNVVASKTNASNVGYCTGFYTATEDDNHYYEAGVFCDATAAADSGILLSHVAIDINKSATETLTVDWTITIS